MSETAPRVPKVSYLLGLLGMMAEVACGAAEHGSVTLSSIAPRRRAQGRAMVLGMGGHFEAGTGGRGVGTRFCYGELLHQLGLLALILLEQGPDLLDSMAALTHVVWG